MNTQHIPENKVFEEARHRYEMASDAVSEKVQRFDEQFRTVCRERPWAVLAGAIIAGFAVGRFLARR